MGIYAVCVIMRVRLIAASNFGNRMDVLQGKYRPIELLRYAGLFLWFCAGIPLFFIHLIIPEPLSAELYVAWFMLHGLFGLMYWNLMQYLPERTSISNRLMYLSLLTGSALGISIVSQSSLGGMLLLIVSVLLPWMLSVVPAVAWLIVQNVLLAIAFCRELLGAGTIWGVRVLGDWWVNWSVMIMAPGAFFMLAIFIWVAKGVVLKEKTT